ncbi:MAG TPA: DUF488 domain-containing protein [Terriglobales bacterium]|nr:DUF488 domain-containing protein [Terriglobales bacterium]
MLKLKRAYEAPSRDDGKRFLVERLWPRGVKKDVLQLDAWLKDVAPSPELRKWYSHDASKWAEFQKRYRAELDHNPEAWNSILKVTQQGTVTLVYAAHDTEHNSAAVLRNYLEEQQQTGHGKSRKKV